jgi:hypothetical protein
VVTTLLTDSKIQGSVSETTNDKFPRITADSLSYFTHMVYLQPVYHVMSKHVRVITIKSHDNQPIPSWYKSKLDIYYFSPGGKELKYNGVRRKHTTSSTSIRKPRIGQVDVRKVGGFWSVPEVGLFSCLSAGSPDSWDHPGKCLHCRYSTA